jgi:hypothetical protein
MMAAASTPRRVGDGGEYFVMTLQLAAGRPPSLAPHELAEVKTLLGRLGDGFESSLLEYPNLVGRDGRQEFLHYFLYPLLVTPALPLVNAAGLHPNWAFTIANAALLAGAVFLIARRAPLVACIAGFVSPVVWWVDKAHTEAFLFAMVSVAAMVFSHSPTLALIAYSLAGAQNAAIGLTYPVFALLLWAATRHTTFTPRTWVAAACGAAIIASPFLYNLNRLGRLSPMAEYAQRTWPSAGGLASFLIEPNIGVVPNAPVFAIALIAGAALALGAWRRAAGVPPLWWWPAVIQVLLLVAWSQNPNANHGGTPGMNRWVLSLVALGLPWIAAEYVNLRRRGRIVFAGIVVAAAVVSTTTHLPSRPESYLAPTRLARWMWSEGWVHVTPAEVFAERVQGREPAFAPAHDGDCSILLIVNQQAPVQCAPPTQPLPRNCRQPGAMCYAMSDDSTTRYVVAPTNGFFYNAAEPAWPAGGALAQGINQILRDADAPTRVWRSENARRWRERLGGADVAAVLTSDRATVVYVARAAPESLAAIESLDGRVYTLIPFGPLDRARSPLTNLALVLSR